MDALMRTVGKQKRKEKSVKRVTKIDISNPAAPIPQGKKHTHTQSAGFNNDLVFRTSPVTPH